MVARAAFRPFLSTARTSLRPSYAPAAGLSARSLLSARGVATKRFTEAHEWVLFDPEAPKEPATIGITDYAQNSLGDIVFVELPVPESQVQQGDQIGAVESVKAASDIFAPVSGVVQSVNESLDNKPSTVNAAAESDGWLCKLTLSNGASEFEALMDAEAYAKHCEGEDH